MTYRFGGFFEYALVELNGLPEEVRNGPLLDRILQLLEAPWDAVAEDPSHPAVRSAFFGKDSEGILTFIVDEETETLRFINIVWLG